MVYINRELSYQVYSKQISMIWFPIKQWNGEFNKTTPTKIIVYLRRRLTRMILYDCVIIDTEDCTIDSARLVELTQGFSEEKIKCIDFTQPKL